MSIIYLIILIFVIIGFIKNYKKTIIIYAPFKLIFHEYIHLYDSGGYLPLDTCISFSAFLIFLKHKELNFNNIPRILKIGLFIFATGVVVHSFHPRFAVNILLYDIFASIIYFLILYQCVSCKEHLLLLLKSLTVVSLILIVNGLIDIVLKINPIVMLQESQAGNHYFISPNEVQRMGMRRTTSFMPHSISMGSLAALLWGIFLILYAKYNKFIYPIRKWVYISIVLLPLMVVFSNSRTPIIACVFFFPVIILSHLSFKYKLLIILASVIFFFINDEYFIWMYDSIFNENKVEVEGSSSDLRKRQWELAVYYILKSPLLGMGNDFNIGNYHTDAFGMESVWLQLMVYRGFLGLSTYVIILVVSLQRFYKTNKIFIYFFMAWIAAITVSSQMGISIFLFLLGVIIAEKAYNLNHSDISIRNKK